MRRASWRRGSSRSSALAASLSAEQPTSPDGGGPSTLGRPSALSAAQWHVGLVVSGTATAALEDGRVFELRAGELFYIPQVPHDSWVVGNEPYVSLHFLGADHYAK